MFDAQPHLHNLGVLWAGRNGLKEVQAHDCERCHLYVHCSQKIRLHSADRCVRVAHRSMMSDARGCSPS